MHTLTSPQKYSTFKNISRSLERPKPNQVIKDSSGFPKTPIYLKESQKEQWKLRDEYLRKTLSDIKQFCKLPIINWKQWIKTSH